MPYVRLLIQGRMKCLVNVVLVIGLAVIAGKLWPDCFKCRPSAIDAITSLNLIGIATFLAVTDSPLLHFSLFHF